MHTTLSQRKSTFRDKTWNEPGKRDTTLNISCSIWFSTILAHFMLYRGNLDCFSNSAYCKLIIPTSVYRWPNNSRSSRLFVSMDLFQALYSLFQALYSLPCTVAGSWSSPVWRPFKITFWISNFVILLFCFLLYFYIRTLKNFYFTAFFILDYFIIIFLNGIFYTGLFYNLT